ncbi:MAG: heme-copper oxidase subunit III [Planctomycetes bacterium]|nr:heme-copper oxidase subunit III [Planctomycetota bacterium]
MTPIATRLPPMPHVWRPSRGKVGIVCLILVESCIFLTFVVAYLFFIGKSASGPQPRDVLDLAPVIVNSVALLSSSWTVVLAVRALEHGRNGAFLRWLLCTVLLGAFFVAGTVREWSGLMTDDRLFLSTNLFGSSFYSLVGLHLLHVVVGLAMLSGILLFGIGGRVRRSHAHAVDMVSWYWHFVDAVWVVVFVTVYVIGR